MCARRLKQFFFKPPWRKLFTTVHCHLYISYVYTMYLQLALGHVLANKLLCLQLFDKVRHEQPTFHYKLHAIPGEMCEPDLGISQSDQDMLVSKIHILFHSAATVRLEDPLK